MEKVLIVDDDKMERMMLERIFKDEHYSVWTAESGKVALEYIQKEEPDIILLDVVMPDENGFDVCRKIKSIERFNRTPIIFITGLEDTQDKVKGFEAGANDYITKPFRQVEVLARAKAHLKLKKMEEELLNKERQLALSALIVTLNHKINNALFGLPLWKEYVEQIKSRLESEKERKILDSMIGQVEFVVKLVKKITELSAGGNLDKIKYAQYLGKELMIDVEGL